MTGTETMARTGGVRHAVAATELAGVVALGFAAGLLVWTLLVPQSVAPTAGVAMTAAAPVSAPRVADRAILWRANPFARNLAADVAPAAAPETTLNLALFGVAAGAGEASGFAVIRTPDNRQQAIREGAEIIPGVTLSRVLTDRVLIGRDGATETLFLPGADRDAAPAAGAASASAASAPDAGALYDAMQLQAEMREGRMVGLRIADVSDAALVAAAGLRRDDVIVEVEGRPLSQVSSFSDLFEDLRGADALSLTVERAGAQIAVQARFGDQK